METTYDLLARWAAWGNRELLRKRLADPNAEPESRARAEKRLAELELANGLDALAANVELVKLMKGWQWQAIKSAREDGATWEQIGQVLGTSKQGALNAYTRAIEHQEKYVPDLHDAAAARAVISAADAEAEAVRQCNACAFPASCSEFGRCTLEQGRGLAEAEPEPGR